MNGFRNMEIKVLGPYRLLAFALVSGVSFSHYLHAATVTATATAVVLTPISLTKNADLSFGDVYPDISSLGTVSIDSGSNRSAGGAAALGPAVGTAAQFTVTGEASAAYVISLPSTSVTLTSASSDTMTVDNFINDGTGTLNGGGTEIVSVGATLHVGAGQAPGSYSGTFDVTVNYN